MAPRADRSLTGPLAQRQGQGCAVDPCGFCAARGVSVCRAVPDASLGRLAKTVTVVDLQKGELLVREGDPCAFMFNVTVGALKTYKLLPDGRRQVLGFLFSGDFLGVGRRATYGFTAEALTAVQLCRFPSGRFIRLLDDLPSLERELLCKASSEISSAQEQMLLLGRKTARERIASFLGRLVSRMQDAGASTRPIHLPMTRTDIADYLGLTTETVSRVFTEFRREGRIRLAAPGDVEVLDAPGLQAIAEGLACPRASVGRHGSRGALW